MLWRLVKRSFKAIDYVVTSLSAIVLLIACIEWMRSATSHPDFFGVSGGRVSAALLCCKGELCVAWGVGDRNSQRVPVEFHHDRGVPIESFIWLAVVGDNSADLEAI